MTRVSLPLLGCILLACSAPLVAQQPATSRAAFAYRAAITGATDPGTPAQVLLPRHVLAGTHALADLRLFDDSGTAISFALVPARTIEEEEWRFLFTITSYDEQAETARVMLRAPGDGPAWHRIEIETSARDFRRSVVVEISDDGTTWRRAVDDLIFDFSSRLDLRKTAIDLPPTEARFVRLTFADQSPSAATNPGLSVRYDGVDLSIAATPNAPFRIDRIQGVGRRKSVHETIEERAVLPELRISTDDDDGNTVLDLGELNLPLTEIALGVTTGAFRRKVEVFTANRAEAEVWRLRGSQVIYRFPGMRSAEDRFRGSLPHEPFVRVKIANGDNPPLKITNVEVAWARTALVFVPEPGRSYSLYWGNEHAKAPRYDLEQIVPRGPDAMAFSHLVVGAAEKNPELDAALAERAPTDPAAFQRGLLVAIILIVVAVIAVWLFSLAKKLPRTDPPPPAGH